MTPKELQQWANLANELKKEREKSARLQGQMGDYANAPQLKYSPVEEVTGPGGQKTVQLRKELQLAGPEAYVQSERERLKQQQALSLDDLQRQQAQIEAQQAGKMAQVGARGGSRALMGRYSMRDALMARQGLGRQFQEQAGELESRGMQLGRETQAANIAALGRGIGGVNEFELEKWKKLKDVEASKTLAEATRAAGGGGGKK